MPDETQKNVDELEVGELTPEEMLKIQQARGRINQCLMEIGHLEVQKAIKLSMCDALEKEGQGVVAAARKRLDIDDTLTLQITPDGKIRKVPDNVVNMNQPKG